jgi:hypothetical protein
VLQFLLGARSAHGRDGFVTLLNRLPLDRTGLNMTAQCGATALSSPVAFASHLNTSRFFDLSPPARYLVPENDSSLNGDVSRGDNLGSLISMKPKAAGFMARTATPRTHSFPT